MGLCEGLAAEPYSICTNMEKKNVFLYTSQSATCDVMRRPDEIKHLLVVWRRVVSCLAIKPTTFTAVPV